MDQVAGIGHPIHGTATGVDIQQDRFDPSLVGCIDERTADFSIARHADVAVVPAIPVGQRALDRDDPNVALLGERIGSLLLVIILVIVTAAIQQSSHDFVVGLDGQ